jgi:hypothetical protein
MEQYVKGDVAVPNEYQISIHNIVPGDAYESGKIIVGDFSVYLSITEVKGDFTGAIKYFSLVVAAYRPELLTIAESPIPQTTGDFSARLTINDGGSGICNVIGGLLTVKCEFASVSYKCTQNPTPDGLLYYDVERNEGGIIPPTEIVTFSIDINRVSAV